MNRKFEEYIFGARWLTNQERKVFYFALALLLTGWAVKYYRTAHPPVVAVEELDNKNHASN